MAETLAYRFECPDLAGVATTVLSVQLEEQLNAPYLGVIQLEIADPDADLPALLGADVSVFVSRAPLERAFRGVVRHLAEDESTLGGLVARLYVGPALELLSLTRETRMFQAMSVPDILTSVLEEALAPYGREVRLELEASYPTREYCMQYQESDLTFVERLMEEEGISYAFDHEGDTEVMVLRDANAAFAAVESLGAIELQPVNLHVREKEPVHRFLVRHGTTTTSAVVGDWDWTKSGDMKVSDEARGADALGRDRESYEHGLGRSVSLWDYSGGAYGQNDVARQKQVRQEAHVVGARVGTGIGRVIGFSAGMTFDLSGHPAPGMDGSYLLTRVTHVSRSPERLLAGDATPATDVEEYHNSFECIPLEVPYRPARRAPKPSIGSVQTAIVTGPAGEEIHVDEHGRIKVRFHWDRESPADETSSCWIRVQQPWAGSGWGFWWVPRIGMEVVVHFVDGDPDRPLVTGCVYNGTNALPYPLPEEKTKSTIKSNSSPGGGGFNELRFEDKAGSEEIFTHAQKDYNEVVENDHNTLVHNSQTNTVDVDQTQAIGANQTETVHGNQEMTVDGNRTVHVKGNFDETVDGTETRHTAGNVSETFDANETRTIGADVSEDIGANESVTISGSQTETIGGSRTFDVGAAATTMISGSRSTIATGGISQTVSGAYNLTATGGYTVVATGGVTLNGAGGMINAAPGGITKIDSQWEWKGGFKDDFGGFKIIDVGVVKIGVCWGAATEFTGFKAEATACNASITLAKNENMGGLLKTVGLKIKARAMKNKAGPSVG